MMTGGRVRAAFRQLRAADFAEATQPFDDRHPFWRAFDTACAIARSTSAKTNVDYLDLLAAKLPPPSPGLAFHPDAFAMVCPPLDEKGVLVAALMTIRSIAKDGLSPAMGKSTPGPYGTLETIVGEIDDTLRDLGYE